MSPHFRTAGVLTAAALLVAACTTPAPQAQVPALTTSDSAARTTSAAPAASADAGRPRERVDMTNEEIVALYQVYNQCLVDHGGKSRTVHDQAATTKAQAACVSKLPLPPWELDASNPKAADFVHAIVLCLRAKGVRYVDEGAPEGDRYVFSFGGANNDAESISKGMQYTPDCEKQAAAQGIGR